MAVLLALPGRAQPLIDHVPDEAALYVGWRGSKAMGPDYEGSNLQGVIEQTGMLEAMPQLVEAIQAIGEQEGPEGVAAMINMGGTLSTSLWEEGGAMYMLPPVPNGPPLPRLAILWGGAKDNEQVRDGLKQMVQMLNDAEQVPVFLGSVGDAMVVSIGFDAAGMAFAPLSKADRFKSAVSQVQSDGALVVYADVQEWVVQVDKVADMMRRQAGEWGEKDPFAEMWGKLREVSGLTGVNRLMLTAGIEDKNWHTRVFLDAPAPRKGLLSLIDNKPIAPKQLAHVPKAATYLQVFSMEPSKVLAVTREMIGAVEPGMVKQMDRGLEQASEQVGFDLEKNLIKGMGPVWSAYIDPMIAGNGISSLVLVNELKDPEAVEKSLFQLADVANQVIAQGLEDAPVKVRIYTQEVGDVTISRLGVPYASPSWMVKDGRLYVALYPQALEMAVEQSGKTTDSILANSAFKTAFDRFDQKSYTGIAFTDLPETAPDGYGINLFLVQTISGISEMFSGEASTMRMPPVGKLMPYIQPVGGLTWVDDQGVHMHSIEPFPGSALLGPAKGMESTLVVSGPMMAAVLLPALGSARASAQQAQTMSNGRQLAVAAAAYAADHDDLSPQDIAALQPYVFEADVFFSANANDPVQLPRGFEELVQADQQQFIRSNSSFVLVPIGKMDELDNPAETVLCFQRPGDVPEGVAIVVCWADGHCTTESNPQRIADLIKAQTGKTIDQLIQRQEAFGN